MPVIRNYHPADRPGWLRCRLLAFFDTCYCDDVWTTRPDEPQRQLVATEADQVVGILDIVLDGDLATIDTICVHPEHRRRGIATALLEQALPQLPPSVVMLDAWTREDPGTLAWYRAGGFAESAHYLHVYKGWDEPAGTDWVTPAPLSRPITAFCHATLDHEADLRARYRRVYVCRRCTRPLERNDRA